MCVMFLEHLLCPLSVTIMCECGRVSHRSARITNLPCPVLLPWISRIVSRFGTRLETEEHGPRVLELLASDRARESGPDGTHTHTDPPTNPSAPDLTATSLRRGVLSSVTDWVKHAPGSRTEQ